MIKKQLTITSIAIASISLMLLASSALLPTQVAQAGNGFTTFEKTLLDEGNCFDPGKIIIKQTSFQSCHFEIVYLGDPAVITDVIPAEWDVNSVMIDGQEVCDVAQKGKSGKSATGIDCGVQDDVTINVWMTTRLNPGKGHDPAIFKPTSCDPVFVINDGAIATSVAEDEGVPVFVGISNSLTINAEDPLDLDCNGVPDSEET